MYRDEDRPGQTGLDPPTRDVRVFVSVRVCIVRDVGSVSVSRMTVGTPCVETGYVCLRVAVGVDGVCEGKCING